MIHYRLIILAMFFFLACVVQADEREDKLHDLLTKESTIYCWDYARNASIVIPRYYDENKQDSLLEILDYWESKCGEQPRISRTRLLLSIIDGTFSEETYPPRLMDWLVYYQAYGYPELGVPGVMFGNNIDYTFNAFTMKLARKAMSVSDPNTIEHLWGTFYTGDYLVFYNELKTSTYSGTRLQVKYEEYIKRLKRYRGPRKNYAVSYGQWIPSGKLGLFGNHPDIALIYGEKQWHLQFDFILSVKFLDSKNIYAVENDGFIDSTKHFTAFFLGVEMGYEFTQLGPFHLNATVGGGWEGIQTVKDRADKDKVKILNSYNFNIGIGSRIYFSKYRTWYMNFYAKYNFVNFGTNGGSDISGNAATLGVTIGRFTFGNINKTLKMINAFD